MVGSERLGLEQPKSHIWEKYMDKVEDLKGLTSQEEMIVRKCQAYNKNWGKSEQHKAENENEVMIFGDVRLEDDELELLNLGPGYMIVSDLSREDMQVESSVTMTKMRWGRMKRGQEEMSETQAAREDLEKTDKDLEDDEASAAIESEARDVISTAGDKVCMGRLRATDMKNNRHVRMSAPASARMEAMYNTRAGVWDQEFGRYMRQECNSSGAQKRSNLTPGQQLALQRLKKKSDKLEVILLEADKGKRFVAVDEATYLAMSRDHIVKDKLVGPEVVRKCQKEMSTAAKALTTILGLGRSKSEKNYSRCHENAGSEALDAPMLKLLPKVHKSVTPQGHPQSRPVVAAQSGITSRVGDILSDFLGPLIHLQTPRMEDQSTEEVLAQLSEAQEEIVKTGSRSVMVGSLDVKSLYPSLDQEGAAEMVGDLVLGSSVNITGVDFRAAQVFLASNLDEDGVKKEGLVGLVPGRVARRGNRPGPRTSELSAKTVAPGSCSDTVQTPQMTRWRMTNLMVDLDESQRRFILSKVVKIAVLRVFQNHVYKFNGMTYLQLAGGPIGLRLTSTVARVVMDRWMTLFLGKLDRAGFVLWALMKYVDDVNVVCDKLKPGWRWVEDDLRWREDWCQEDEQSGLTVEMRTMNLIREAANHMIPWLEFTQDLPELHETLKVPMLDVQVWVDHDQEEESTRADVLVWEFFEKKSNSTRVLLAMSAYEWRAKLVVMNMEIFRRQRNTSRQITEDRRVAIMNNFVEKLRRSGYCKSTVHKIIQEGTKFYFRKLRADLEGGPALNLRSEKNKVMTRRAKLGAAETWYVRKRGGGRQGWTKDHGWRSRSLREGTKGGPGNGPCQPAHTNPPPRRRRVEGPTPNPTQGTEGEKNEPQGSQDLPPEATLKVPFTIGSTLKNRIQKTDDEYSMVLSCKRIRVIECGGDKLVHVLGKSNPWAARQVCDDTGCKTCSSRTWIKEYVKAARKEKVKVPKFLARPGSTMCRREGANYSLQCLECLVSGVWC